MNLLDVQIIILPVLLSMIIIVVFLDSLQIFLLYIKVLLYTLKDTDFVFIFIRCFVAFLSILKEVFLIYYNCNMFIAYKDKKIK